MGSVVEQRCAMNAHPTPGAKLTATGTRRLERFIAPAPGGQVGRGQICFGQI